MKPRQFHRRPSRRAQRGAAVVFAAIAMIAGLVAAMLAIDLGRVYTAHRNLQKLASVAAMDAVRVVGGCDRVDAASPGDVDARVRDSLARNNAPAGVLAETGDVDLGYVSSFDNLRHLEDSSVDDATAVGVQLSQPFPQPLLPLMRSGEAHTMFAHAVATQDVIGTVSVGSSLLSLDSTQSPLLNTLVGGLLGGSVNLSLASWQGLARANVTLDQLAAAVGVGTPAELLATRLTRNQALEALSDVLLASEDAVTRGLGTTLRGLADLVDTHGTQLEFGDILAVDEGGEDQVGGLPINAADLLLALAEATAAGYPINLPLSVSLASISATLRIGQPPQIGIGRPGYRSDGTPRTKARTSQIYLQLNTSLLDTSNGFGLAQAVLDLLGGAASIKLDLAVEVAAAEAVLREVRCARTGQPRHEATVDVSSALATVQIGDYNLNAGVVQGPTPLGKFVEVELPLLGNILTLNLDEVLSIPVGGSDELLDFDGPFVPKVAEVVAEDHVRHTSDSVGDALDGVVDGLIGGLVDKLSCTGSSCLVFNAARSLQLTTVLAPVATVLDTVLGDLLALAGIQLGGATVTMESLEVDQPIVFLRE